MQPFVALLEANPILLLFLVSALGFLLGQLRVAGFSLGVSAVLFVGLGFGAISPGLRLPEIVYQFGLVLFVYTIALASGPGFFAAMRRQGLRDNFLVLGVLLSAALLLWVLGSWMQLPAAIQSGLLAGALTNTPALAGALEAIKAGGASDNTLGLPVAAYALAYPMGVVAMLLALHLAWRWWGTAAVPPSERPEIVSKTLQVSHPELTGLTLDELRRAKQWQVVFGRLLHQGQMQVATGEQKPQVGDLLSVIGPPEALEKVSQALGPWVDAPLDRDRQALDFRRLFVSNRAVAGVPMGQLHLPERFGVVITRVRRGDVEFVPNDDTVLELGDRVRVVGAPERLGQAAKFLGDSYKDLSEVDVLSFGLGIALGLLIGQIALPLPGGGSFKLGLAGGPLVVGLVLGALNRTGPILWRLPYSANLTLRQLGVILFLAGIGTRSGSSFAQTLASGEVWPMLLCATLVTAVAAILTLWVGYRHLKIPLPNLAGMLAGLQTQPAVLAFALEKSGNEQPNMGYATVYPLAMLLKIILAQLLLR